MKLLKFDPNKSKAQAMVEFAIVLPILLLLLYGILEVGRLLFLYSTVVTASRQAARYGSTTGEGGTSGQPRYQDCDGIREAAQNYAILGAFDNNDITIQFDQGPNDASPQTYCPGTAPTSTILADNEHRIVVTVEDEFVPLVALVPLEPRTISATSSRTIFVSVPIVVDSPDELVTQDPTTIQITSDSPDSSEMGQAVTVSVTVTNDNDPTKTPTGTVIIADSVDPTITCEVTLTNGSGSCTITYATVGVKTITALYTGDDEHTASDTAEGHMVDLADTVTTITSDAPDPSIPNQNITVVVSVTGGSTTPTGTVSVSGGGGASCTVTLAFGAGSCSMSFNSTGNKTITADYNGDSQHNPSSDTETHQVLQGTPTPTLPPTLTLIPTNTLPPTVTPVPPTLIAGCDAVTIGLLQISGNTLSMTITNPLVPLEVADVTIRWNHDKGHQTGSDKTLILQSVSLGGTTFWTGNDAGPLTSPAITPVPATSIPTGTSTIVFTFQQSYDNWDNTESVTIDLWNPGCSDLFQTQH